MAYIIVRRALYVEADQYFVLLLTSLDFFYEDSVEVGTMNSNSIINFLFICDFSSSYYF